MELNYVVQNIQTEVLIERLFPTVLTWNRLEGRPRRQDTFDRSLRAEVRDALWMICRQWQLGEFQGDDAGSPIEAQIMIDAQPLRKYQPGGKLVQVYNPDVPMEALVEQRPLPFVQKEQVMSLDIRLQMGRQWLKMITPLGNFTVAYRLAFPIAKPDPKQATDAGICAHQEVWQQFAAVAGRAMDGYALYQHLKTPGNKASDVINPVPPNAALIDAEGVKFVQWYEALYFQPENPEENAWQVSHLEYQVLCEAAGDRSVQTLEAAEYFQGRLDWYNFDLVGNKTLPDPDGVTPAASTIIRDVFIPTALTFDGMPNTRWWTFEDGKTNFGALTPNKTDLGKMLLMEFGLVYANDWFIMPVQVEAGQTLLVRGLSVTNVFGERIWIEPAAAKPAAGPTLRWRMFTLSNKGIRGIEDLSMLLLPTVPKVQESAAIDEVLLVRDEIANMVWGIERIIPTPTGRSKSGFEAATETKTFYQQLVPTVVQARPDPAAPIQYQVMNSVPENWIPFIAVHEPGNNREVRLQRAAMPRLLEGDATQPKRVTPRSIILREGLDQTLSYFIHEEEVTRAGTLVSHRYQRTRWYDGRVYNWLGVRKMTGRGEANSGLAFDRIITVK
ncbi:hypothetical protein [Haliscomenobacter sp.]|uniref:hypothetical protein n=1 Tax=Haliscomenobacter sp. TaxID=2717303 RepID=UPI003BA92E4B